MPVSVSMLALVEFRLVTVPDVKVPSVVPVKVVTLALVAVRVVTVAEVMVAFVKDRLETVKLPILATVNEASAQVRLEGFVPTSTTALLLFIVNKRRSAVLTANSAPPAKLVRFAVPGTAPGVLLRFNNIVGMDYAHPLTGFCGNT